MNFQYTASGNIRTGGCAKTKLGIFVSYLYGIGSILFFKAKALKGIYEKVVVKKVIFPKPSQSKVNFCDESPLYVDTLNALFNEDELVTYDQAVALVAEYKEETIERNQDFALKFPVGKHHRHHRHHDKDCGNHDNDDD